MQDAPEWLEEARPVRASTAARLDARLAHMENLSSKPFGLGSVALAIGRTEYERDEKGVWTHTRRTRNPAWLAQDAFAVIADACAEGCPCLVVRYPNGTPWHRLLLPALTRLCRAQHGKALNGDGIVLDGTEAVLWESKKRLRFRFDGRDFVNVPH